MNAYGSRGLVPLLFDRTEAENAEMTTDELSIEIIGSPERKCAECGRCGDISS